MLPSIAQLASKHKILPLKQYGQNFILDSTLCDKILRFTNINSSSSVLEVGPGIGGLTRSIMQTTPKELTVIEKDIRCIPLIQEIQMIYPNISIHQGDALKYKLADLSSSSNKLHIVSNLPYNIGTALLIQWLKQIDSINVMILMLQKEVVDRINAKVNKKEYGRLSVICQIMCDIQKCFDVSPNAFYPKPKVNSGVVKLTVKNINLPSIAHLAMLEKVTFYAFSGRRKMLKSSLKPLSPNIEDILYSLSINYTLRAENISPQEYLLISDKLLLV